MIVNSMLKKKNREINEYEGGMVVFDDLLE